MGRSIGVFDSGVGGLSVLRHIRQALPNERLTYIADSGHVPYGDKPASYIEQRSLVLTRFLVEQGADAIVIACNTATAAAAASLRNCFDIPIVAMEPAVKPAVAATRNGVVGVLATVGTLESARFAALLERYAGEVEIVTQGCPGLVEQVEQGNLAGVETRELITRYIAPLLARGADTIILGCTHYPFLTPLITEVVGPDVMLVDTGSAVARQLQYRIQTELPVRNTPVHSGHSTKPVPGVAEESGTKSHVEEWPDAQFWTSGDTEQATRTMSILWGEKVETQRLPQRYL